MFLRRICTENVYPKAFLIGGIHFFFQCDILLLLIMFCLYVCVHICIHIQKGYKYVYARALKRALKMI